MLQQLIAYNFLMIREYIFLAVGCVAVGVVIAFIILVVSQRLGINIMGENMWVLAIPALVALILNIILLELYRKFRRRK